MHDLAASERTWIQMSAAAREKIQRAFERSQQIEDLESVYRKAMGG